MGRLVFQDISKRYGAVIAIKHAEMEIKNGEVKEEQNGAARFSGHIKKVWCGYCH